MSYNIGNYVWNYVGGAMKISGLKEYVYQELKNKLIMNHFKPGERIWEEHLAEELGVSRTPVREAINQLVAEGFIENRPRKGIFAAEITKDELRKMLDVRLALESLAIKECCKNITEEQMKELDAIYQTFAKALEDEEYSKASQWDSEIHRFIAQVANNKKLAAYVNDIQDVFAYTRGYNIKWTKEKADRSIWEHKKIIEAIKSRNEEVAIEIVQKDIDSMRELLSEE
ncbi:MAG TPA: hypothetical protein DEF30_02045 [Proteiniclasticum sp.]|nr:hypothetical protein [Proteiniclasticum sp.]